MITGSPVVSRRDFEDATGWSLKPGGACKGDVCIPLPTEPEEMVDVREASRYIGLPLVHDPGIGLYSLGPESISSRALVTAVAPDFELPDLDGTPFRLSSLRGQKVILLAWAPY